MQFLLDTHILLWYLDNNPKLVQLLALPFHHRDPFDRLIIAQAQVEQMTVISIDALFARYPVTTLSLGC